jgi:diguanylate cyclase (GGDEF)-like protein
VRGILAILGHSLIIAPAATMYVTLLSRKSLRTQIAVLFGVLVALIVVLGAVAFAGWIERSGHAASARAVQLAARNAAYALAQGMHERSVEIRVLAQAQDVWRHGLAGEQARALLARIQARHEHAAWAGVASTDGTVLAATNGMLEGKSVAARPWFQQGLHAPFTGDVHKALLLENLLNRPAGSEPARFVDFAAPIRVDDKVVGVLGMHGGWEWTGDTIESLLPLSQERLGLEVLVFDAAGELIYTPPGARALLQQPHQLPPGEALRQGRAQVIDWPDGMRALSAYVRLPAKEGVSTLGWQIVARQPIAQAYADSTRAMRRILGAGLLFSLLGAFVVWRLARRLSLDLHQLAQAAGQVRSGSSSASLPQLGGSREVRELSDALAHMAQRLLDANHEMEGQVQLRTRQLEEANRELDRQAHTDALTGLLNRRGFEAQLSCLLALAERNARPLSVVTFDIDHFKRINDVYGHATGDVVLQHIASTLKNKLRASDVVARVGGEEFVALLPDTYLSGAQSVAESAIAAVAASVLPDVGTVTLSAGVASLRSDEARTALLERSDAALYQAKQGGRNQVCVAH